MIVKFFDFHARFRLSCIYNSRNVYQRKGMKQLKGIITVLLAVCIFTACSSSDDDEISETGLTGKWDLTEVLNGPAGKCQEGYSIQYSSGTVIIELKGNGKIVFNYEDGKVETLDCSIPADQEKYGFSMPVMNIGEVPFGYTIEGNRLKLHYLGAYCCDHIPATFVFKRTK